MVADIVAESFDGCRNFKIVACVTTIGLLEINIVLLCVDLSLQ